MIHWLGRPAQSGVGGLPSRELPEVLFPTASGPSMLRLATPYRSSTEERQMTERSPDTLSSGEVPPATPRWVKILGVLTAIVGLVFLVLLLAGGHHGPGRHFRSGPPGSQAAPAGDRR